MRLRDLVDGIERVDPSGLRFVSDTTFEDVATGRYHATTPKGVSRIYSAIGVFDRTFVGKLDRLDHAYCSATVSRLLRDADPVDVALASIGGDLRAFDPGALSALESVLADMLDRFPDATAEVARDVLELDTGTDAGGRGRALSYDLSRARLSTATYSATDLGFVGVRDRTVTLDDPILADPVPYDALALVRDRLDHLVGWEELRAAAKGSRSKGREATLAMSDALEGSGTSDRDLRVVARILGESHSAGLVRPSTLAGLFDDALATARPRDGIPEKSGSVGI